MPMATEVIGIPEFNNMDTFVPSVNSRWYVQTAKVLQLTFPTCLLNEKYWHQAEPVSFQQGNAFYTLTWTIYYSCYKMILFCFDLLFVLKIGPNCFTFASTNVFFQTTKHTFHSQIPHDFLPVRANWLLARGFMSWYSSIYLSLFSYIPRF